MANNREISQFAGLVTVADSTNNVSLGNTFLLSGNARLGVGTNNPLGRLQVGAGTSVFVVTSTGSVGVGTDNPSVLLDTVLNQNGSTTIQVQNDTDGGSANASVVARNDLGFFSFQLNASARTASRFGSSIGGFAEIFTGTTFAGSGIKIGTTNALPVIIGTDNAEALRIDSSQSVGIGTNAPATLLHVHEVNSGTTPLVRIQNSSATPANNAILLELFYSGDDDVSGAGSSAHYIRFRDSNTNPTGQISGSTGTGVLYAEASDYRLKEDITPSTNGIERIMQFKPCEFTWKESQVRSEGFIAHEVQEVFPEAVVGSKDAVDEEGNMIPQMIDPAKMVVVLTAALQEAIQRIQYLESVVGIGSS